MLRLSHFLQFFIMICLISLTSKYCHKLTHNTSWIFSTFLFLT